MPLDGLIREVSRRGSGEEVFLGVDGRGRAEGSALWAPYRKSARFFTHVFFSSFFAREKDERLVIFQSFHLREKDLVYFLCMLHEEESFSRTGTVPFDEYKVQKKERMCLGSHDTSARRAHIRELPGVGRESTRTLLRDNILESLAKARAVMSAAW